MSTVTPKLGLIKPASGERFSRADYSSNMDKIDAGVKAAGLVPFGWAQKGASFGNPWDGPNDTTIRSPDMGSHNWSWRIGLSDADIVIDDENTSTKNNTYLIKKPGLWHVGFKMQGNSLANAQRITIGVTPLLVTPPSDATNIDQWGAENGFSYSQIYDDGSGSVPIAQNYGHFLWKTTNGTTTYRPGFFAKRSGTTAISAFNGTIGFTYLGPFA